MSKNVMRSILFRERGTAHGPITRLISPTSVGELLKPFIFLDFFSADISPGTGFGMHPHSGIATLTWQPGCDVQYEDTTGQQGVLKAGGLEWMNAGGGAWHQGFMLGSGHVTGFQLWVPMPPAIEDGASLGQYIAPQDVPIAHFLGSEVRVLLGQLEADSSTYRSPIDSHHDVNYLVLTLQKGASWTYVPPPDHDVAWAFAFEGTPSIQEQSSSQELVVFAAGTGSIRFSSPDGPARVLLGSAKRYQHELVVAESSVHSNLLSLEIGRARIKDLEVALRRSGKLSA